MPARKDVTESLRCLKHNLVDGRSFSVSYSKGLYYVTTAEKIQMCFERNPYQAFEEVIAGYLQDSAWALAPGMYVIDAGACFGEFTLYASRCVGPSGRVIALEPDLENLSRLRATLDLNGGLPENVTVLPVGLWKHSGKLAFAAGGNAGSQILEVSDGQSRGDLVSITVVSLVHLIKELNLDRLDFVKMDIEGAELEAVEGAAGILATLKPRFAIASYHVRDGETTARRLEKLFQEHGYKAFTGFPRHLTTYACSVGNAR